LNPEENLSTKSSMLLGLAGFISPDCWQPSLLKEPRMKMDEIMKVNPINYHSPSAS
jgi:hypothetical protein